MLDSNVDFHNVAELCPVEKGRGRLLQRVPESVRLTLNENAQMRMRQPDATEIRFVADGPCKLTLSSQGRTKVTVFHGMFDSRQRHLIEKTPQTIELLPSENLSQLDASYWQDLPFSPHVFRVMFGGADRDPVIFHGIEGKNIRPPQPNQVPNLRYLAYGTSITHGFDAEGPHLTYVSQAARALGADLINLGVGGAAHCEATLADYIAQRDDWHIATLALSVNMQGFDMDTFYQRVSYMVNTVAGADTTRPVACITIYPYFRDWGIEPEGEYGGTPEQYRQALRDAVAACPHPNVHLIQGPTLLTDISNLTSDLIHPSDLGMIQMGQNLTKALKPLLKKETCQA